MRFLTPAEVARAMRLRVEEVYRAIWSGRIQARRTWGASGKWRVPVDEHGYPLSVENVPPRRR